MWSPCASATWPCEEPMCAGNTSLAPAWGCTRGQFCTCKPAGCWRSCFGFSFGRKEGDESLPRSCLPSLSYTYRL